MPRNMAMEGPHARIVRVVLEYHIPFRSQIERVPPHRILRVDDRVAVPLAVAFVQDPVFVAVEMHWLWKILISFVFLRLSHGAEGMIRKGVDRRSRESHT